MSLYLSLINSIIKKSNITKMPPKKKQSPTKISISTKEKADIKKTFSNTELPTNLEVNTIKWNDNNELVISFIRNKKSPPKKRSYITYRFPSSKEEEQDTNAGIITFDIVDKNKKKLKLTKVIEKQLYNSIHNIISNTFSEDDIIKFEIKEGKVIVEAHLDENSDDDIESVKDNIEDKVHDSFIYTKNDKHVQLKLLSIQPIITQRIKGKSAGSKTTTTKSTPKKVKQTKRTSPRRK